MTTFNCREIIICEYGMTILYDDVNKTISQYIGTFECFFPFF